MTAAPATASARRPKETVACWLRTCHCRYPVGDRRVA